MPTLPRYKQAKVAPLVQEWAEKNGVEYRVTDQWKIIADNIKLLKNIAKSPSDEGSPHPKTGEVNPATPVLH